MVEMFTDLEKLFKSKSINMENSYFNNIVREFECIYLSKINYEIEIQKRKNLKKIITIDYDCDTKGENSKDFLICCFDTAIFIFDISEIFILKYFLSQNIDSQIYCVSEDTIQFLEKIKTEIQINYSNKDQNTFIFHLIINLLSAFKAVNKNNDNTMKIIKKCLTGYLIYKAYNKSCIDRLNHSISYKDFKSQNQNNKKDKYILLNTYFGTALVYLEYNIEEEQLFIVKIHRYDYEQKKLITRELDNYEKLKHPLLPRLYESIDDIDSQYIVIEYINGKTINDYDFENNHFSEYEIIAILFEIMIAIHYLHSRGYVYRDLKGNNIMIDESKTAVLIDFDRIVNVTQYLEEDEFTGDLNSMNLAPEINDPEKFSNKVDIYSLGLLINEKFLVSCISEDVLSKLKIVVETCTKQNPDDRPTISQLIRYLYLNVLIKYEDNKEFNEKLIKILEDNFKIDNINDPEGFCTLGMIFKDGIYVKKNIEKSIDYYTKASNQNDLLAKINLSFIYSDDKNFDKEKTLKYLKEAADQDDPFAQYLFGSCISFSAIFDHNFTQGVNYLERSATKNLICSQCMLGFLYAFDPDIKNINHSIQYFELAIENQNINIKCDKFFNNLGKYVLPNFDAVLCYKLNNGKFYQILSMIVLARIFSDATFAYPSINRSLNLYSQISKQKITNLQDFLEENNLSKKYFSQDDLDATQKLINNVNFCIVNANNFIGKIYIEGLYVPRNIPKALECFKKCNNTMSQYYLGYLYSIYHYNKNDVIEAIDYYHSVFEKSNDTLFNDTLDSISLCKQKLCDELQIVMGPFINDFKFIESIIPCNIGDIYYYGIHVNKDIKKAIYYYKISADKSNPYACFNLANIYFDGINVKKDVGIAFHYYKLAAKYDHTISQYYLGLFYYGGQYVPKNISEAIKYFYVAANKDNINASFYIGTIYYICKDYMRDMNISINYYRKASCFKDPYAKNNLGIIYKNGDGCKKCIDWSIIYLNEAINLNNNEVSRFNLAHIYFYGKGIKQDLNKTIQLLTSPPIKSFNSGFKLLCLAIVPKCINVTIENIKNAIIECNPSCDISIAYTIFREINKRRLTDYYIYQIQYEQIEMEELVFVNVDGTFITRASIEKNYQNQKNKSINAYKRKNISKQFYEGFDVSIS